MARGYMGKILKIDLSTGEKESISPDEATIRTYIGGSGLGARFLYDTIRPATDPLGPNNPLMFLTGPLTGTKVPTSGRHAVVAKSPATGAWGEADCGGNWGSELKEAGWDGVIVTGRAEKPVYIYINDDQIEIRNASEVWGKDTYETDEALRAQTDSKAIVQCIGPAGEKLARIAGIFTDGRDGRAAGRGGLGAVMGSKNLKAIVVKGSQKIGIYDPQGLKESLKIQVPRTVEGGKGMHNFGTAGGVVTIESLGDLPLKNWLEGSWPEGAANISGPRMTDTILTGRFYCRNCTIGCGRVVEVNQGPFAGVKGGGPEYETVGALGALNLVDNLEAIAMGNEWCNRYGIDTISTGSAIAFATEAFENGLIGLDDTGGIELKWGDANAMVQMIHKIGKREDIGWLLGEGTKRAAEKLGGGAMEMAIETKGLELPMHDPRALTSLAIGYATSNRGADHLQGFTHILERGIPLPELGYPETVDRFATKGKGELAAKLQNLMAMMDSLKVCKFLFFAGIKSPEIIEWTNLVTGYDFTQDEFMKAGERLYNLKRLYNVREGIRRQDDTLPNRILIHKRGSGSAADNLPDLETMLEEYYAYRHWDAAGIPTMEKLEELGLV